MIDGEPEIGKLIIPGDGLVGLVTFALQGEQLLAQLFHEAKP